MDNNEKLVQTSFARASRQMPITLTQLVRVSRSVHDIDEFLTWLAYLMVRELNIQVIQFWANQASSTGRNATVLRTIATQDRSLPSQVIVNARVVEFIDFLLKERRGAMLHSFRH